MLCKTCNIGLLLFQALSLLSYLAKTTAIGGKKKVKINEFGCVDVWSTTKKPEAII